MKVLVTGGTGFIGSHICEQLVAQGHEVVALVRRSSRREFLESLGGAVQFVYGSVEDRASLDAAVQGVDAIIHSAGLVKARSEEELRLVNVQGAKNMLDAARARAGSLRRFVHISSQAATAPSSDGNPVHNDVTPRPVTAYGRSKLDGERAARAAAKELPITIIRPPMVYGPRDEESFAFFQMAQRGVLPMIGEPESKVSTVFGPDCARACILAIDADVPSGSAYFVTDGDIYTRRQLNEEMERAVGRRAWARLPIPGGLVRAAAVLVEAYGSLSEKAVMLTRDKAEELMCQWVCDGSEGSKALHLGETVKWSQGTQITHRWYQEHHWY